MMHDRIIRSLGDTPALLADGRRTPDRREISMRWLSGTFLTGLTGTILMGVALFAAVDGRQQLAIPAEAAMMKSRAIGNPADAVPVNSKGKRLFATQIAAKPSDKTVMSIPTVVNDGELEVVRKQPFALVKMTLAANYDTETDYPRFDPLDIFSSDARQVAAAPAPVIYGSDVESEVGLKTEDFPTRQSAYVMTPSMTLDEVEENVRTNGSVLTDGDDQVSELYYVDPQRFASNDPTLDILTGITARVVEENISVTTPQPVTRQTPEYADDVIPVHTTTRIAKVLTAAGYDEQRAADVERAMSGLIGRNALNEGEVVRVGIVQIAEKASIVRVSVYSSAVHVVTIAANDQGAFVAGSEPPPLDAIASAFSDDPVVAVSGQDLPRIYDGIYRAALTYGMGEAMTGQIIKLLASSVDFQAKLKPTDQLEAFFSCQDEKGTVTEQSELLFIKARFGDNTIKLYRFQDPSDMSVDYFDENGKSIRQFLLRNPVPNGIFKSGFGMRRHPILGYMRMHTGVDWAAPRGTPIIAAGTGIVEKAGWDKGGYGNQTLIRHANGYVTSYNHQSAIAKGVVEGGTVRQGQIIGWVGTTGLSTGPHLHYEVIVNGNRVDPQRIRLPGGKSLKGDLLARFEQERARIDALLAKNENKQIAASQ